MYLADVQRKPALSPGYRFHGGAGQAGRAQVLQRAHFARRRRPGSESYWRQKVGVNSTSTLYTSSRPVSIIRLSHHFTKSG